LLNFIGIDSYFSDRKGKAGLPLSAANPALPICFEDGKFPNVNTT
jgi:hypothetical protein